MPIDSRADTAVHAIDPYVHRQLFLDDHAIEESSGVRRVLHQPERLGAILKPDVSRGQMGLQSKSPPWWNPELRVWEWWYWAMYDEVPGQMYASEGRVNHYATSTDGVNWDTSPLGMHEFRGSKDNNVAYDASERGLALYHIIRDDSDPDPDRRFKGIFATADRLADRIPGFSPDGFDWTFPEAEPTPSKDTSNYLHDVGRGRFVGMVKHGTEWGRSVWLVTSEDFVNWTDPRLVLHSDLEDRRNRKARVEAVVRDPAYLSPPLVDGVDYLAEIYQMALTAYEGMYIGFPMIFNPAGAIPPPHGNFTALNQTELAVSRDLLHWERVADRALFLDVLPWDGVNFESAQLALCGPPVRRGDELWVYYGASRFRGPRELYTEVADEHFRQRGALCLGKLRLDGFVSLDADDHGFVTTKPFAADGGGLRVNADAGGGALRAEVLDAGTMEPLPGMSLEDSRPLEGDHLRGRLAWNECDELPDSRPVRIRFALDGSRLYSFWMEA